METSENIKELTEGEIIANLFYWRLPLIYRVMLQDLNQYPMSVYDFHKNYGCSQTAAAQAKMKMVQWNLLKETKRVPSLKGGIKIIYETSELGKFVMEAAGQEMITHGNT